MRAISIWVETMPGEIETFLPHRAPMRWIEALIDCTDNRATATARFDCDDFAVANGKVLETALVECVAQTIAAAKGYRAQKKAQGTAAVEAGMLVAISCFRIEGSPAPGKELLIEVCELKQYGPMLLVSGSVSCEGQEIAAGELTLRL
jgi:predicted hotdog family 3-hydroxylacyl-ACP dehydratase